MIFSCTLSQSSKALLYIRESKNNIKVQILGEEYILKFLGKGGTKFVFDLGNGTAVAFLNTLSNSNETGLWKRIVEAEVMLANKCQEAGLYVLSYEKTIVYCDGNPTIALKMPTFESMLQKGMQIRDQLNKQHRYGTSMIFANKENLANKIHWQELLSGFQHNVIAYYGSCSRTPKSA